jgi:hypothetical protein
MEPQPQLLKAAPENEEMPETRFILEIMQQFTSIGDGPESGLPQRVSLEANYPNPFNPATEIQFSLPEATDVRLEVFSINGQQVATLASERMSAGTHQLRFDAGNLASGVYLYRLQTPTESITRKMTLLK